MSKQIEDREVILPIKFTEEGKYRVDYKDGIAHVYGPEETTILPDGTTVTASSYNFYFASARPMRDDLTSLKQTLVKHGVIVDDDLHVTGLSTKLALEAGIEVPGSGRPGFPEFLPIKKGFTMQLFNTPSADEIRDTP